MSLTFGLPVRHPAVVLALACVVVGYAGLLHEASAISNGQFSAWDDWGLLLVGVVSLPLLTGLFLRIVARPQDFVKPATNVVAIYDSARRLQRVRILGYFVLSFWLTTLLYIGFAYL